MAATADQASSFSGASATELETWLERAGVDTREYGKGVAKTVEQLFEEVYKKESELQLDGEGRPLRCVHVLSVHVLNSQGQVLFEEEQVLPDGRVRRRDLVLSEKMLAGEAAGDWRAALDRAVAEELGSTLPPQGYEVTVLQEPLVSTEHGDSMSYPGLNTHYTMHRVKARVSGIPEGPFSTTEERPGGQLLTKWVWKAPPQPSPPPQ